ncbi:uncharacterized protein B0H18DRAFT_414087 [Fomitopsis serialis]|uniref:uncharacterized protein n=1 Tax=Fomitopsis serialis TaxID=139415 RepID=UPI002007CF9B|nr:uncharacterized protein B0H18DRAFT_414087 [Neoantrodia serialis]KAH9935490.1 hypothetical protein B0H18DRAFT_414087 [Neoantrodia serialis]
MNVRTVLSLAGMRRACSQVQPNLVFSARMYSSRGPLDRPSPPSLPREQQREFEELMRAAQAPLAQPSKSDAAIHVEADLSLHPDARRPIQPEFEGTSTQRPANRVGRSRSLYANGRTRETGVSRGASRISSLDPRLLGQDRVTSHTSW